MNIAKLPKQGIILKTRKFAYMSCIVKLSQNLLMSAYIAETDTFARSNPNPSHLVNQAEGEGIAF